MASNSNLHTSKARKEDEFYTLFKDVDKELVNYKKYLKGKTIYLNCDDHNNSAFYDYMLMNFEELGIKKIISTHVNLNYAMIITKGDEYRKPLHNYGDFRSEDCIKLLKQSDIVISNPPFSLFREYLAQLIQYKKKFLIIGNMNAITYKEVFPLIKSDKVWLGMNYVKTFKVPSGELRKFGNVTWFTNLPNNKRHEYIPLTIPYDPDTHKMYDNYDIVNVNRIADIPYDYKGIMGVPITLLNHYNPKQFKIVGSRRWAKDKSVLKLFKGGVDNALFVNGKEIYDRIFIKKR